MNRLARVFVLSLVLLIGTVSADAASFRLGDQGSDIAEIQGKLAGLGYDVTADGDFGPATAEAIKSFQSSHGLTADGLVGEATYTALLGRTMPEVSRSSNYISRRVIANAMNYIGVPYVFGGTSPAGFDCSGYVRYIFAMAGVSLPRMADEQYYTGAPISAGDMAPGDLGFFSTYEYGPSHVGIYSGNGNFVHASSSRGVVVDSLASSYWSSCYIGARRVM